MKTNTTSLKSQIREMDADELQAKAEELLSIKQDRVLNGEEQEALWAIPLHYKQLTGQELIIETTLS
jgi:hypothetical protein